MSDRNRRGQIHVPARCKRSPVLAADRIEDVIIERLDRQRRDRPVTVPRSTTPTAQKATTGESTVTTKSPAPSVPSTSTSRPRASERLVELEIQVGELMDSAPLADRLIREVIAVKAEDIGCDPTPSAITEHVGFGGGIGFLTHLLEVVNEALNLITATRHPGARAFIAWQAIIGVVFRTKLPLEVVFRLSENTVEELLKERTPQAHGRFCQDRTRVEAERKPEPKPEPRRSPLADRFAAKQGEQRTRGERGGNRGRGQRQAEPPCGDRQPAAAAPEDDDRQPPGLSNQTMSLAQAVAGGGSRRR